MFELVDFEVVPTYAEANSSPPTMTGSHIPGVVSGALAVIDYTGNFTAWYEGTTSGGGPVEQQNYVGPGDGPPPVESSLEGNPAGNFTEGLVHSVWVGGNEITVVNYNPNIDSDAQIARIDEALGYLNSVYNYLDADSKEAIASINSVGYTEELGRSGVDLVSGDFVLAAADMVGSSGHAGYSTLDIADRVVHDGWHVEQFENGLYAGVGNPTSDAASLATMKNLERDAINVELSTASVLQAYLPIAATNATYNHSVADLHKYVDTWNPDYTAYDAKLEGRLKQAPAAPRGGRETDTPLIEP